MVRSWLGLQDEQPGDMGCVRPAGWCVGWCVWAPEEEVTVWSGLWMTLCHVFQGQSVHTFDLKLVWVDPEQDG